MKPLDEILKLEIGPTTKQQLIAAAGVINVAKETVTKLEELRAKRAAERPLELVTATSKPSDVAKAGALTGAVTEVLAAIDDELNAARAAMRMAETNYRQLVRGVQGKRQKLIELESEWGALGAQIEQLRAELAA